MNALPLDSIYNNYSDNITDLSQNTFTSIETNTDGTRFSNSAFMINVTLSGMKDTHLSSLTPDMLISDKIDSEPESLEADSFYFERFKKISMEYAAEKAERIQAGSNFLPIRDCFGVVDDVLLDDKTKESYFEARIYNNESNEFIEIIRAPLSAFKKSDAELLNIGSVFYWKVGYRSTSKGTRVKVNEFNLRRIIREKSVLRTKRVEKVVGDLMSIFK